MTWTRACTARLLRLAVLVLAWAFVLPATAQGIESVLRPGDLIQGHAKWENDCSQCHVKFDRAAQDRLCMDCHKPVGQDVRSRAGFHGRLKPQPCRACHTDHKGREARVAGFDRRAFDHAQTDYVLRGRHQGAECDKCHSAGKKWRDAPQDCLSCHRSDDVHKRSLGTRCGDCHGESDWKQARFDHEKTRFALTGKHADAKCGDCHKTERYETTPRACIGCHRKEDDGAKGHKGQYGEKCEACHGTKAWRPSTFSHDADTKFALRGKHRGLKCGDCHTGRLYRDKLGTACVDCHTKDDKHKGGLGRDCASCHTERDWKEGARFDHDKTVFPLRGKHRDATCQDCHRGTNYKGTSGDCLACHLKDDKHERNLGTKCGDCHQERDWKTTPAFDHGRTKFPLVDAHAPSRVKCSACHADLRHYRDTAFACIACHRKDDKHAGTQGEQCDRCHNDRDWKVARFDHRTTRFQLLGRHALAKCEECHATKRYRDTPRDCYACHKSGDKHALRYGFACDSCHNARGWGLWTFDHERQGRFVLDGAHARTRCDACHTKPAPAGRKAFPVDAACVSCHRRDDSHDGAYGAACERCHVTEGWKRMRARVGATMPARAASGPTEGARP